MIITPNKLNLWTVLLFSILFCLIKIQASLAQNTIWVNAEGTATVRSNDLNKARTQAIKTAKQNAVMTALTSGITTETLLVNLRLSGSILSAIPYGKVVKKNILKEGLIKPDKDSSKKKKYHVRIKAGVVEQTDTDDFSFHIDASINQPVYKNGDELKIYIQSTRKCYFAVFNIIEGNKIIPLLPNDYVKKNHLTLNEKFIFPGETEEKKGFKIKVYLPDRKTVATESIYIIGLLHPFKLELDNALKNYHDPKNHQEMINDQKALVNELIRKIVTIPIENRAEALIPYEIRKT
jgi:Holliday junction resolvase RusA-like endonuclease